MSKEELIAELQNAVGEGKKKKRSKKTKKVKAPTKLKVVAPKTPKPVKAKKQKITKKMKEESAKAKAESDLFDPTKIKETLEKREKLIEKLAPADKIKYQNMMSPYVPQGPAYVPQTPPGRNEWFRRQPKSPNSTTSQDTIPAADEEEEELPFFKTHEDKEEKGDEELKEAKAELKKVSSLIPILLKQSNNPMSKPAQKERFKKEYEDAIKTQRRLVAHIEELKSGSGGMMHVSSAQRNISGIVRNIPIFKIPEQFRNRNGTSRLGQGRIVPRFPPIGNQRNTQRFNL